MNKPEETEEIKEEKPEYTFDLTEMELTSDISDMHQEGNYLVGTTDKGIRFRHRIPQGKILNKINGKYVLEEFEIREVAQNS